MQKLKPQEGQVDRINKKKKTYREQKILPYVILNTTYYTKATRSNNPPLYVKEN